MNRISRGLIAIAAVVAVVVIGVAALVWSGVYNVGADDPHLRSTDALLETLRERSIEVRARNLTAPDLSDQTRIVQGAGNYNAMCTGCHLAPGMPETELSKGLYPSPPNLTKHPVDAVNAFWVIKHGIKASGMPAWGASMQDDHIWNMAAFLQELPNLDHARYKAMVARSDGHSHGGGESSPHADGASGDEHHQDDHDAGAHAGGTTDEAHARSHADGADSHDGETSRNQHSETLVPEENEVGQLHTHALGTPAHDDQPFVAPARNQPVSGDEKPSEHKH